MLTPISWAKKPEIASIKIYGTIINQQSVVILGLNFIENIDITFVDLIYFHDRNQLNDIITLKHYPLSHLRLASANGTNKTDK